MKYHFVLSPGPESPVLSCSVKRNTDTGIDVDIVVTRHGIDTIDTTITLLEKQHNVQLFKITMLAVWSCELSPEIGMPQIILFTEENSWEWVLLLLRNWTDEVTLVLRTGLISFQVHHELSLRQWEELELDSTLSQSWIEFWNWIFNFWF